MSTVTTLAYKSRLPILILLALGLRLNGIDHGSPSYVSGDERPIIEDAVHLIQHATLEPTFFNYPSLYTYLLSAALFLVYILGAFENVGGIGASLALAEWLKPVLVALYGRLLSTSAGVLLVAITYAIGKRCYGKDVGLGSALFVAVSSLLVAQSRFALPDVTMALLATTGCYYLIKITQRGVRLDYLLAGIFIGLACSAKYNAAMVLLALPVSHLLAVKSVSGWRNFFNSNLLLAIGLALLAFLIGSPYLIFSFDNYWQTFLYERANMGFSLRPQDWPIAGMLTGIVNSEMIWGLLGMIGVALALRRRTPVDWVILAIIVPSLFYIGSWPKTGLHYLIFLYPLLGILGMRILFEAIGARYRKLMWALVVLITLPNIVHSWIQGRDLNREDVRIIALEWIEENIPSGTVIGGYWVQYCPPIKSIIEREKLVTLIQQNSNDPSIVSKLTDIGRRIPFYKGVGLDYRRKNPKVPANYRNSIDLDDPKTRQTFSRAWRGYEEMKRLKVEYVILPEAAYGRFLRNDLPPDGTPEHYYFIQNRNYLRQFFDSNSGNFEVIREFGNTGNLRGPKIIILRVL